MRKVLHVIPRHLTSLNAWYKTYKVLCVNIEVLEGGKYACKLINSIQFSWNIYFLHFQIARNITLKTPTCTFFKNWLLCFCFLFYQNQFIRSLSFHDVTLQKLTFVLHFPFKTAIFLFLKSLVYTVYGKIWQFFLKLRLFFMVRGFCSFFPLFYENRIFGYIL